jgi:hypothetical protein
MISQAARRRSSSRSTRARAMMDARFTRAALSSSPSAWNRSSGKAKGSSPAGQELLRQLYEHYLERPKNIFFWSEPIED